MAGRLIYLSIYLFLTSLLDRFNEFLLHVTAVAIGQQGDTRISPVKRQYHMAVLKEKFWVGYSGIGPEVVKIKYLVR